MEVEVARRGSSDTINIEKPLGTEGSFNNGKVLFKEALSGMNTEVTKSTPIVFSINSLINLYKI